MKIKYLLIIAFVLLIIWIPVAIGWYDSMMGIIITLSSIVAGFVGERVEEKILKKRQKGKN